MKRIMMLIITILLMMTVFVPLATDNACAASSIANPLKHTYSIPRDSEFWNDRGDHNHAGIDMWYLNIENKPVYSATDGVVKSAGWLGGYGKAIVVKTKINKKNYYFLYGHLNGYNVKTGENVTKGQKIGKVGNTGQSYGAHLHFEIRKKYYAGYGSPKSYYLDPAKVLNGTIKLVTCNTHKINTSKGICSNCELPYTSWDTNDLNTSTKTAAPGAPRKAAPWDTPEPPSPK